MVLEVTVTCYPPSLDELKVDRMEEELVRYLESHVEYAVENACDYAKG